jgi:hypothetical protein
MTICTLCIHILYTGPDLYPLPYFSAKNFPDNMPEIWDKQIGFVEGVTGKALVLGEVSNLQLVELLKCLYLKFLLPHNAVA